jgi:molybdopterin converting factor small subunit
MHDGTSTSPSASQPAPSPAARRGGTLRIGLFAGMAEAAGSRELTICWSGGTAATLRRRLAEELPALGPLVARSAVAIGSRYVTDDTDVPPGVDVAIIPPVSGG